MVKNKKSQHGCVSWALCEHLTSPCHDFACGGQRDDIICLDVDTWGGGVAKNQKIVSPFQAILNNFDSFIFDQNFF